ncbi:YggS family pyridoxal phosphate-dependent enzyme [Candidatus Gracilibacteria bacterium]|nr:YggS family pyridoxal phosphate-dependent enzyme [Candidatus Gracilibacteria bacterium]
MIITERLEHIHDRIAAAARRSARNADEITLVAVTKTHAPAIIAEVYAAGVRHIGENRVQEAASKAAELASYDLRWHLIGHLQRNKARRAIELFHCLHSIDNLRLAETLARLLTEHGRPALPVLLQLNISGEQSKEGFNLPGGLENPAFDTFCAEVAHILALPHLQLSGLMTVAPWSENPEQARPIFRNMRSVRDELARRFPQVSWHHLSMGMSDDFAVAIEEGATIVRIGRALFGERA